MNLISVPPAFVVFYICITQKNLHVNFRSFLFLTTVGQLIGAVHRLIIISTRICCIAGEETSLSDGLDVVLMTGLFTRIFGWFLVVADRAVASAFPSQYDQHCVGFTISMALCSVVAVLIALILFTYRYRMFNNFGIYCMGVTTTVTILCFLALVAIIRCNMLAYRRRHIAMLSLRERYHLDENIRCGKYLIPVAVNDALCRTLSILLVVYWVFFTSIPLGHDVSHLGHAYDLLAAYQRLFFGLSLTIQSEKLDKLLRRRKRYRSVVEKHPEASSYYNDLKRMWA